MSQRRRDYEGSGLIAGLAIVLLLLLPHVGWSAPGAVSRFTTAFWIAYAAVLYLAWRNQWWKTGAAMALFLAFVVSMTPEG